MISFTMETPEMIGSISLGFVPLNIELEVGSRHLAKRISPKLVLNLRDEK